MNKSENQPRPYRTLGIVRHSFPEFTRTEKAFVAAFVFCGLVAAIVARPGMKRPDESVILGLCAYIMGPTLCYWMWHEPAAILQLLLFPYTGRQFNWPRIVLMLVRGFGLINFFACLASFPLFFLPASWTNNLLCELTALALAVTISVRALGKRPSPTEPRTQP